MSKLIPLTFKTEQEAAGWMYGLVNDDCVDNYRFAYHDDADACLAYEEAVNHGCCGSFDREVIIKGRHADIGCNYGH